MPNLNKLSWLLSSHTYFLQQINAGLQIQSKVNEFPFNSFLPVLFLSLKIKSNPKSHQSIEALTVKYCKVQL